MMAQAIFDNKIIAFHRGRTEVGPRALCHRSILANPTNPNMKDIINNRIKHRENFRPFAPVVTKEMEYEIFDLKQSSPYMLLAPTVKKSIVINCPLLRTLIIQQECSLFQKKQNLLYICYSMNLLGCLAFLFLLIHHSMWQDSL